MKLKKVVSLALAGVMAVSMLAGCATGKKPGTGEGEGEGTVTGYSAKLADIIESDLDYVSFKDNAADQTALQAAVDGLTNSEGYQHGNLNTWVPDSSYKLVKSFMDKADVKNYDLGATFKVGGTLTNSKMNASVVATAVYAADGSASMDQILENVATSLKPYFTKGGDVTKKMAENATANGKTYEYNYVVSASVVTRTFKTSFSNITVETPVTFIAVTVTRTGTPAEA